MTRIKFCGLSRACDIEAANALKPEYVGFVFARKSRRYVSPGKAALLKRLLAPGIQAVGVFVDEEPEYMAGLLRGGVIDMAQLHGGEDEACIRRLRQLAGRPVLKAFCAASADDIEAANRSAAEYVLLDSGAGTGKPFDWKLLEGMRRPYFLAGGLGIGNVEAVVKRISPFAVDVSSGIETHGVKDKEKMAAFVAAVRKEENV